MPMMGHYCRSYTYSALCSSLTETGDEQIVRVGSLTAAACHGLKYRYKNRQCHCLSGSYMARSANLVNENPPLKEASSPAML